MPYNERGSVGKQKGKFITKKLKQKIKNFMANTKGKGGRRISAKLSQSEASASITEDKKFKSISGRRIIDVEILSDHMWCPTCNKPISLRHLLHEKQQGLASTWSIQCSSCFNIVIVQTSKKSAKYRDTNVKLSIGMLDAGVGETKINTLLSALNIPKVDDKSLKRYERYAGRAIEELADKSCVEAIETEKALTMQHQRLYDEIASDENNNTPLDLIASFDAAWRKRGRQYNSLSGHASLQGYFSKKVIAYACRNIYCKQCKKNDKKEHECKKNHTGSSRAMEADMAVEVVLKNDNLVQCNCRIETIIGDDDSSSIAALRKLSPYPIKKWSDFNHVAKTFNSKLYEIKLTASLREYFSKMFALAVKQNKGDEVKVKLSLESIIPHAFGEHNYCGSYCKKVNDDTLVYKYFKDGKCLSDINLREKLEKIIKPFINNVPQIAQCASSQSNESFNNTICSKHPKSAFYGGSESHEFRVALAVSQKNVGYCFIMTLNKQLQLSPGKYTEKCRKRKQEICIKQLKNKQTIPTKRRRLILKKERSSKNIANTNRECISYQSGCGYINTSHLIDEVIIAENADYEDCELVATDIETTGLDKSDEIIQIAAVSGNSTFNVYIMPSRNISLKASEVTGITITNALMYVNKEMVETVCAREGVMKFLYFLKSLKKPCILLAHNGFRFDAPRILNLVMYLELLKEFKLFVKGFCDSLHIFKSVLPDRIKNKQSFSESALATEYLDEADIMEAHNALNDVLMLQKLFTKLCNNISLSQFTRSIDFILDSKERLNKTKEIKKTLLSIKLSACMINKIAKTGISRSVLEEACETGGLDGLSILLGENVSDKPRVTNNKRIIKSIFNQLSK